MYQKYNVLKIIVFLFCSVIVHGICFGQKIDSIYVHLYTDSLRKGTYNYINIDGKLANGHYVPLDTSSLSFSADAGVFYGNSLWIAPDFDKDKVSVRVVLKQDKNQEKSFDLFVKKARDPKLPTEQEIINSPRNRHRR